MLKDCCKETAQGDLRTCSSVRHLDEAQRRHLDCKTMATDRTRCSAYEGVELDLKTALVVPSINVPDLPPLRPLPPPPYPPPLPSTLPPTPILLSSRLLSFHSFHRFPPIPHLPLPCCPPPLPLPYSHPLRHSSPPLHPSPRRSPFDDRVELPRAPAAD